MNKIISQRDTDKLYREFLPEALEIVEKPASPLGHFIVWFIITILIVFLVWSIIGRIDISANARGKVITAEGVQTLQSVNAGIITEICAREGDKVRKGEKIIVLDSYIEKENLDYQLKAVELLKLKIELLNKVLNSLDITNYIEETMDKDKIEIIQYAMVLQKDREALINQYKLSLEKNEMQLIAERKSYNVLKEKGISLEDKKDTLKKIIDVNSAEMLKALTLGTKVKELEKELKNYRDLYKNDAITKVDLEKKQNEVSDLVNDYNIQKKVAEDEKFKQEMNVKDIESEIKENNALKEEQNAKINIEEKNLQLCKEALKDALIKSNEEISELIVKTKAELQESILQFDLKGYNYKNQFLTAPMAGTIQKLAVNTVGGVVSQAQPLVEIVPLKSELVVEADLSNKDIGYVKLNQKVKIKVDTYNYQKYGTIEGKVEEISPNSIENEKIGAVYKIKIIADDKKFRKNHSDCEILTGMECTVEIKTGNRRIISFFLEPIIDNLDRSIKVR